MKKIALLLIVLSMLSACKDGGSGGGDYFPPGSAAHACEAFCGRLIDCGFYSPGKTPCQGYSTAPVQDEEVCILTCQAAAACSELEDLACYWVTTGGLSDCVLACRKAFSFECEQGGNIIPESWVCDGYNDCGDGSDEQDCPEDSTFTCQDGEVIGGDEVCDSWPDCDGGEDEEGWELVMIVDAVENTVDFCNAGNPGADIDAVELYRDDYLVGWVNSVEAIETVYDTGCDENDMDDPAEMLGAADGHASDDIFDGYFSLNGRTAYLLMSTTMRNGDELVIYEMFNAANPDAAIEDYQVYLGYYTEDGDMAFCDDPITDWYTGMVVETIDGLW